MACSECIALHGLEVTCSFSLLTFLAMYFVENKHLDQASEYKATFFKDQVPMSAEAVHLRRWLNWV